MTYDDFKHIFMKILDLHAPIKERVARGNNQPFVTKQLRKAIMTRSTFKNKYNKNANEENGRLYKKQRNFCVSLLRKEKKNYYNNLDLKIIDDNKKFWCSINPPLFSDKQKALDRNILIVENENIFSDNKEVAEKLNNFFIDAVENLGIEHFGLNMSNVYSDEIDDILKQYELHPSILKIKEIVIIDEQFRFSDLVEQDMQNQILQLNSKKAGIENDLPAKMLQGSNDIVSKYLCDIYNNSKFNESYPSSLKIGTVTPVNKKSTPTLLKKRSTSREFDSHCIQVIGKEDVQ